MLRLRFDFQFGFGLRLRLTLFLRGFIPWTPEIGQFQTKVARVGRVGKPGFEINNTLANQLFDLATEILHTLGGAISHRI